MGTSIRRSTLILPVNIPHFVEKAYQRGADGVLLDLEDSVPPQEKESARRLVKDSIPVAARGGAEVFVRVNKAPDLLEQDLEASVHSGLDGITFPKTESAEEVHNLLRQVESLEKKRGLTPGHIAIALIIETPRGVLNIGAIASASPRVKFMSVGPEDYCLELGVEPSPDGMELFYAVSRMVVTAKANGIRPMGLLGSIGGFRDLVKYEEAAKRGRQLGCEGASGIHPDQIKVLNRVFSPDPEKVEQARRAAEAFEEGLKRGTASVNVDGKMVDVPVYNRARLILERAKAVEEVERRKAEALRRLK
jgi:citrate lyase subunit beta/citryl-CoA lyase